MAHYYNHKRKESTSSDIEINSREIRKLKVKHAKAMTGKTRMQIAEMIGSTLKEVDELWEEVKKEEAFKLEEKVDSEIRRQIRQYEIMNIELFEAWQLSKEALRKTVESEGHNSNGVTSSRKETIEERLPDPRYMEMIAKNNKEIASLLGITKAAEISITQQSTEFNVIGGNFTPLVPDQFAQFIQKPDHLPEAEFTSIEDTDEEDSLDSID